MQTIYKITNKLTGESFDSYPVTSDMSFEDFNFNDTVVRFSKVMDENNNAIMSNDEYTVEIVPTVTDSVVEEVVPEVPVEETQVSEVIG